jgi:tetratricopeptide (TPR) repeat protein
MKAWQPWVLTGFAGAFFLALLMWAAHLLAVGYAAQTQGQEQTQVQAKHAAPVHDKDLAPLPKGRVFTRAQADAFLDAAKRAEAITDPLQRCLAYPDPPGSHWAHDAVVAYCHYHNQPTITLAQARQLILAGHAAELDQMLSQALHAQLTEPGADGQLDFTLYKDFDDSSFDTRSLLDAWKRQAPHSAFAYAASGIAYVKAAFDARGEDYLRKTPESNIESMERLAVLADQDLQQAIKLNPKLTSAYQAMVNLGGLVMGNRYALTAAKRGLAVQPDNWGIYDTLMWVEQPNWYGSLDGMANVTKGALKQANHDPLLKMLIPESAFYRIDHCNCAEATELPEYIGTLANLGDISELSDAAYTAKDVGNNPAMAIYLSEYLRFDPGDDNVRIDRMYALMALGHARWALEDGNRLVAESPNNEYAAKARGSAYFALHDLPKAQKDFMTATDLDPKDMWAWGQLGRTYASQCEWDEAWQVGSRLVEQDPAHSDGWLLKAVVQAYQPRPGLKATVTYLSDHFGTDSAIKSFVGQMEPIVKWLAARQAKAASGHGTEQQAILLPPWYKQCPREDGMKFVRAEPSH